MITAEQITFPDTTEQTREKALLARVDGILESYRGEQAETVPLLQHVQKELGYLPVD